MAPESITRTYRFTIGILARPIVRWWGRLKVTGVDLLPISGPLLIVANHDSYMDPVVIGSAAFPRRQIRALAKAELWKVPGLGRVLDGMGQIPINRGSGDAGALDAAIAELKNGTCIGVFPEGTTSRGRVMRPRSGAGRLIEAVPATYVVSARVKNAVDVVRFPKRPNLTVEFFLPAGGQPRPEESPQELMTRLTEEIRIGTAPVIPGRKKKAAKYRAARQREKLSGS